MAEGLSEPQGNSLPPSLLSLLPLPLLVPATLKAGVGMGWGKKEEEGSRERRAQAARAGREGQVSACWGRMAAETGSEPQGPGIDSFPPLLLLSPLISSFQVPPPLTTHTSKLHPPSSPSLPDRPPLPPFPLILGPEGCRSVRSKGGGRRWEWGWGWGGRVRTFPSTPPGQDQPPPPASHRLSYNIHEPHEYAMFSLWGRGLTRLCLPLYHSLYCQEKRQVWEERTPDVEPDEGGGGTGR